MYVELDRCDTKLLKHIFGKFKKVLFISIGDDKTMFVTPKLHSPGGENFIYVFSMDKDGQIQETKKQWVM